jgi:hypothetical protein
MLSARSGAGCSATVYSAEEMCSGSVTNVSLSVPPTMFEKKPIIHGTKAVYCLRERECIDERVGVKQTGHNECTYPSGSSSQPKPSL